MAAINMQSILAKAQACMNTSKKQKEVRELINKVMLGQVTLQTSGTGNHTPEDAAAKFIEVLHAEMNSAGLSPGAVEAIYDLNYTTGTRIGNTNQYLIRVYFTGDLSRPSLQESKYGSINDLAELFNYGVDHKMHPVHGVWHGKETWSRTVIPGTHFMEQAITDFMSNYGSEYNVTNISIEKS